jgi:SGNH hydrolase-like domain, acetyltransferase AlgX
VWRAPRLFGLAEVTLRIYDWIQPLPIFYSRDYNRFRGKPFAPDWDFRLNSKGFKDVEFEQHKAAGIFRILGIGDSFAFGVVPYSANYLTILKATLRQNGKNVDVINMGIQGIGPKEYLALLIREGLALEPDMVLLSFFIGNDFKDTRQQRRVLTYSYVLSFLKYVFDLTRKIEGVVVHRAGLYDDNLPVYSDAAYLSLEHNRDYIYVKNSRDFERDFDEAISALQRIKAICNRNGIKLSIVIIPDELQVNADLRERLFGEFKIAPGTVDMELPNKRLAGALQKQGIDYLDLLPDFAAASSRERLYRPNDGHWNIRGNAVAAKLITRHVLPYMEGPASLQK